MRTPLIAANWKMHKTIPEAEALARELLPLVADVEDREVVLCPPFPALAAVAAACRGSRVAVGAQDLHWEAQGAYTGAVSAPMLLAAGCRYVIVGHSERRRYFGEDDATVNKKLAAAFQAGLKPILCLGETLAQRELGLTEALCEIQLRQALAGVEAGRIENLVVAYEPVWAIGTGRTPVPEEAQAVVAFLRRALAGMYGPEPAGRVRLLYGGSVTPENIGSFMAQPDIDGALVGGASLKAETFAAIVKCRIQ
ncbi:MAG: triose-phosphate isomerase [Clostridia bacterium]|jgi:triosephosphate isomerase|nr:triose-phosphate isomerase [Clostridia bacterium]MDH7572886.1 triose-phosphate isomerase [Clostridia bacterium]